MNAFAGLARRHWQVTIVIAVFALFSGVHAAVFGPALVRYRATVRRAAELGMPLDPESQPPGAPAVVLALLGDNSLNAALAEQQGNSGALTAGLLDEATGLAARSGLAVLSTDQGLVTQLSGSVQVRAHLRMRGTYAGFVRFLDATAGSRTLLSVDRFTMNAPAAGAAEIEVWLTQLVLKRTAGAR